MCVCVCVREREREVCVYKLTSFSSSVREEGRKACVSTFAKNYLFFSERAEGCVRVCVWKRRLSVCVCVRVRVQCWCMCSVCVCVREREREREREVQTHLIFTSLQVGLVQKTSESRKGRKPPFQRREKGAKQPRRDESNTPSGAGGDMSNAPNAAGGEGDESNSPATAGEEETRDDNGKELGHPANEPGAMETKKEPGDAVKDAGNTETTSKQSATDANNDADVVAMETENKMAADVADESRETRGDAAREAVTRSVFLCKSAAPKLVIPGHTGYLTFATLFPEFTSS